MIGTHTTKDGATLQIAEMDNSHIENTIKLICRNITQLREHLDGESDLKPSSLALMGNNRASHETIAREFRNQVQSATPYVAEACLRGLAVGAILRAALGRSAQLPKTPLIEAYDDSGILDDTEIDEHDFLSD